MKKLLLIVLGITLSVLILELILRFQPRTTLKFYDNNIYGSAYIPSQSGWFVPATKEYKVWVEINSHGWPDVEHSYEKPEGIYRIVILGDSFVENTQMPFEKRFFRQLQENLGGKYEVIATGRGNTGTAQQYLILKNYSLKYKPDLVIQMFLTANDIKNNSPELQKDPYLPYFEIDGNGNLKEVPHRKRSERTLSNLKETLKNLRIVEVLLSVRQRYLEEKGASQIGYPIDYHIYDRQYSSEYQKAWEVTKKLILESKSEAEKSGAQYIFISLPNNEQVNSKVQEALFKKYPKAKEANLDFEKPDRILSEFCTENEIKCYFMLPYFKEFVKNNPNTTTHNFYEGHWDQTGVDLATKFLIGVLSSLPQFAQNPSSQ